MGLINTAISNLLGGVSQQADSLRGASNCEEQINAYPSPVNGLVKRPPVQLMTEDISGLSNNFRGEHASGRSVSHVINRDSAERYLVTISNKGKTAGTEGGISVWDLKNNEEVKVYYDEDAMNYINPGMNPTDAVFSFATAGDVTYISRRGKLPVLKSTLSDAQEDNGIIHVRQGASDTEYKIKIDGTQIQHETPVTGDNTTKTSVIAANLLTQLTAGTTTSLHTDTNVGASPRTSVITEGTLHSSQFSSWNSVRVYVDFSNTPITRTTGSIFRFLNKGTQTIQYRLEDGGGIKYIGNNVNYRVIRCDNETAPTWVELKTLSNREMSIYHANGDGIASVVLEDSQGSSSFGAYSFTRYDSTILIHNTGGGDFNLEASDSVGDTYLKAFKGTSQYFSDLPESCIDGLQIEVTGSAESAIDDYFVEFSTDGTDTYGKGSWIEKAAPNSKHILNPATMPHILIRQADGTFLFKKADGVTTPPNVTVGYTAPTEDAYDSYVWEDRKAGDDETNPLPNFVGTPIEDIFFYENRLGMLSGESVTLSESGQFFNFFRTTVIDLLDTAPIEVVGSSNSVNTLRHAIPFNGNLILFGDNTQFMLGSGREGLSPKTVAMRQVSNYECDAICAPVIGGTSVYFAYPRGSYGGLQDMVIRDPEASDLQAFDLTDSVPSYIERPFRSIATIQQENLVIGLPTLQNEPKKAMGMIYNGASPSDYTDYDHFFLTDYKGDEWKFNINITSSTINSGDEGPLLREVYVSLYDAVYEAHVINEIVTAVNACAIGITAKVATSEQLAIKHTNTDYHTNIRFAVLTQDEAGAVGNTKITDVVAESSFISYNFGWYGLRKGAGTEGVPAEDMNTLYFYKYLDRGNERLQSAWFKFVMPTQGNEAADTRQIIGIHTVEHTLYILSRFVDSGTEANSKTMLHKIEFTTEGIEDLFKQPPLLDNVIAYEGTGVTLKPTQATAMIWTNGVSAALGNVGDWFELTNTEGLTWRFLWSDTQATGTLYRHRQSYISCTNSTSSADATEMMNAINGQNATLKITASAVTDFDELPTGAVHDFTSRYKKLTQDVAGFRGNTVGLVTDTSTSGGPRVKIYNFGAPNLVEGVSPHAGIYAEYDGSTSTTFTLPYGSEGKTIADFKVITKWKEGDDGGVEFPVTGGTFGVSATTIIVAGDKTLEHVWIGHTYPMTYKYANPIIKGPSTGGGSSPITAGRYQIHAANIVYHDSSEFNVAVDVEGRGNYSYAFNADSTQVDVTSEGSVGLDSGDMRIPVHAESGSYDMTITSDSAYPVKLLSTEFEAQYNARSRRMGG